MLRLLAGVVFAFLAASGLLYVVSHTAPASLTTRAVPTAFFEATGTIQYYPNNAGTPIPYLFYHTDSGALATKIILFCGTSAGPYAGAVVVEGYTENESVCATSIAPM